MASCRLPRPFARCLRDVVRDQRTCALQHRSYTVSSRRRAEVATATQTSSPNPPFPLDPNTVHTRHQEKVLVKTKHINPIGSRRRRAAIATGDNVPFEQQPYQCFQEARKILAADREDKLAQIVQMRARIHKWSNIPAEGQGGAYAKEGRLRSMRKHLEELKILADVNDPVIKKRFEDGTGMLPSSYDGPWEDRPC